MRVAQLLTGIWKPFRVEETAVALRVKEAQRVKP